MQLRCWVLPRHQNHVSDPDAEDACMRHALLVVIMTVSLVVASGPSCSSAQARSRVKEISVVERLSLSEGLKLWKEDG